MQKPRIIRLALPEGDAPPTEFRLFTAGKVRTEKGVFLFDEEAQKLVMEGIERRKTELMLDYNHASLDPKPLDPALAAKASGWHEVELRKGELWAVNIRWSATTARRSKPRSRCSCRWCRRSLSRHRRSTPRPSCSRARTRRSSPATASIARSSSSRASVSSSVV